MLKINSILHSLCSSKMPNLPPQLKPVLSFYKSGKSTVSISQHVLTVPVPTLASGEQAQQQPWEYKHYPNYYIQQQLCKQLQKSSPQLLAKMINDFKIQDTTLTNIYRLLVKGNIGNKDLGLDINSLKANAHIKNLVALRESNKFVTKTSQIIIDDAIQEKKGVQIQMMLKNNILEVQKLIETGMQLPISFMISKQNVRSKTWLKCLAKKRKAIHSDIMQCFGQSQNQTPAQQLPNQANQKKPTSLQQFVYANGYKLEHLFLRPYNKGCPIASLAENDSFNLEQLIKVLAIINFEGKLILQNTSKFLENVKYLDETLKKCGYQKKKSGQIDLIDEYMIF